jgi:adenylate cyclase
LVNHVEELNAYSFAAVYASLQALHRGDLAGLVVPPDEFEDKIVYLGASAVGLADIKATPLSPKAPGVTLHVSLLSNMLTEEMITDAPAWHVSLVVVVFVSLTAILVLAGKGMLVQSSTPFILSLVYVGWAWWQFQQHVVYNMATPLGAIMLTAFALWAFIAATEGRDKRRVRAMFSQYVSPAVLGQLTDGEHNVVQAEVGQMERLTVLFSDVRGFTGISEQLEPAQVVELLNIHFSVMSEVIFDYDGTLDKFIGDAIMAFWGAPIRVEHHAELAVRAALEMERGLLSVNRQLEEKGYPSISIGIGLNTGDSILGNIGSFRKLDYTVIGDTVNIASRLEGLTKLYGQGTIISEYTLAELPQGFPCAILDLVRVKGKEQPLAIHAPLGLPEDEAAVLAEARQLAEQIYAAFAAYRARHWDEAIRLYRALPESQAVLQQLFISRCEGFKLSEPTADWDGVYTLQSK